MLVLGRKENESVVIGDPAKPLGRVTVVGIKGERVRLAFDFPTKVGINRQEIADKIVSIGPRKRAKERGNG